MFRRYLLTFLVALSALCTHAQKVQTVTGEYLYHAPDNITLDEAKRIAVERARLQALADAFGTMVSQTNTTIAENRNGQSDMTFLSSGGSEVKGEWLQDTKEPDISISYKDGMLCVLAKVCGKAREINAAAIDIEAYILKNGTEKRFESNDFRNGDDLFLYFRSPIEGYLTVYLIDDEHEAYCLLPYMNDNKGSVAISAGKEYIFFSQKNSDNIPSHLVDEYTMTCSLGIEQNSIYVIFSGNGFTKANDSQKDEGLPKSLNGKHFLQWLSRARMRDKDMTVIQKVITVKQ